ncbi:hypothetical protein EDC04DRAFT_2610701 [Pisolithus marmoratus]|nr:hypothetical protein EDC04DRAFT_2610701 [Pisolithus marmoratus]
MTANDLPLFLWSGDTPGCNIDHKNEYEDLFQGYYLERVMHHIFTGPLTALGNALHSTHPPNATLHQMTSIEPEHITYSCLQCSIEACYAITSWTKWSKIDGSFNYCTFYYNVVDMIQECPDKGWVDRLKRWWNVSLFKNEFGHEAQMAAHAAGCTGAANISSFSQSLGHPTIRNLAFGITATSMTINSTQSSPLACRIAVTPMTINLSPVGSEQMPMMDDSDQFASKELLAVSTTQANMKASRKGKGCEVAFLGDKDKLSAV